jgi:hypothetical protein
VGDDSEDGYDSDGSNGLSMAAKHFEVIKLMVCSPNLIAALFWSCDDCNYIAVCRPGASLWSVAWDLSLWITDMAFYQGKLYALD